MRQRGLPPIGAVCKFTLQYDSDCWYIAKVTRHALPSDIEGKLLAYGPSAARQGNDLFGWVCDIGDPWEQLNDSEAVIYMVSA